MGDIAIVELADELQVYKQTVFKAAKRLGINPGRVRDPDRGNQLVATLSQAEAEAVAKEISTASSTSGNGSEAVPGSGVFYIMQLEPEHDVGRIKVGFTTDLEGRLRKHRCSAPFAECVQHWPARRTWERAAIDCITEGLEQLHTEVYRADDLKDVLSRAQGFFDLMPVLGIGGEDEEVDFLDGLGP